MLNQPRNWKYIKQMKRRIKPCYKNNIESKLIHGFFGIVAKQNGKLLPKHMETLRRTLTGYTNRQIKIWFHVAFDTPLTSKPIGTRMGKGKGAVSIWCSKVYDGKLLVEVNGKDLNLILKALQMSLSKLPLKTVIISRSEQLSNVL